MKRILIGLLVIFFVVAVFFWKVIILGRIAFPGDVLVGMYYPWLSEKYGYEVGVPIKNPMLSDPVSQDFVWKSLVAQAYREGGLPLWNPYSYSGYPLLANLQSGAMYPFNLFMVWFGDTAGWNMLMIAGVAGCAVGMYLYLLKMKLPPVSSVAGALTYGFSGFAMTWMMFATGAQVMIWIPFLLLAVELAAEKKKLWMVLTPAATYYLITAGQAHIGVYSLAVTAAYAWYRTGWKNMLKFAAVMGVGAALAAPQLLATGEMSALSVRNDEGYISAQRWGLIPPVQLITGVAADFFGNPATGNHWGWWQYHETVFYAGVLAIVAVAGGVLNWKKLGKYKFFLAAVLVSLAMGVDWPVGRVVYRLNLPIVSTGSAGRVFVLYTLGAAVLTGWWVEKAKQGLAVKTIKAVVYPMLILGAMVVTVGLLMWMLKGDAAVLMDIKAKLNISVRNAVFPMGLLGMTLAALMLRKRRVFGVLIVLIVIFDLFRAGWKYLPFVDAKMVYPEERIVTFLKEKTAGQVMRIDRERGELLPPNTWAMYRLSSPSGYDPLAGREYAISYERELNGNKVLPSRYAELTRFDAEKLGKYNVKYLLAVKRDAQGRIPGDKISYKIDEKLWKRVMETDNVMVLENSKYQERARINNGKVEIGEYKPGRIELSYQTANPGEKIVVADSYFPGWTVCEEVGCNPVGKSEDGFMEATTKSNKGEMLLIYKPESFRMGMGIAGAAIVIWLWMLKYNKKIWA